MDMEQPFRFGFVNDHSSESEDSEKELSISEPVTQVDAVNIRVEVPKSHTFQQMTQDLPDLICYDSVEVRTDQGHAINVLRRELFDIRAQIMAEDTLNNEDLLEGLSKDDIKPGLYEGGFKTWECSIDLARYLVTERQVISDLRSRPCHVIELGAGSALPALVVFRLCHGDQEESRSEPQSFYLTLADYNLSVLCLATIPNILLNHEAWRLDSSGTMEIRSSLQSIEQGLSARNIHVTGISGSWGDAFNELLLSQTLSCVATGGESQSRTLILASETIYSPETTPAFASTLFGILTMAARNGGSARALVAAKIFYFGVGGGINNFLSILPQNALRAVVVWKTEDGGVGRVILEIVLA